VKEESAESEDIRFTAGSIQHSYPHSLQHILGKDREVSGRKINKIGGGGREKNKVRVKVRSKIKSKRIIRAYRRSSPTLYLSVLRDFSFPLLSFPLPAAILSECTHSQTSLSLFPTNTYTHLSSFSGNIFFKPVSSLQWTKNKTKKTPHPKISVYPSIHQFPLRPSSHQLSVCGRKSHPQSSLKRLHPTESSTFTLTRTPPPYLPSSSSTPHSSSFNLLRANQDNHQTPVPTRTPAHLPISKRTPLPTPLQLHPPASTIPSTLINPYPLQHYRTPAFNSAPPPYKSPPRPPLIDSQLQHRVSHGFGTDSAAPIPSRRVSLAGVGVSVVSSVYLCF